MAPFLLLGHIEFHVMDLRAPRSQCGQADGGSVFLQLDPRNREQQASSTTQHPGGILVLGSSRMRYFKHLKQ